MIGINKSTAEIANENIIFDWRVSMILNHARAIAGASHLFDALAQYDCATQKLDLRLSAKCLRDAAEHLDAIARDLQGPETSFPEMQAAE